MLMDQDFYKISLHKKDQELILGTVIFSQRRAIREYGIQLVRKDSYHPGMVKVVLDLVHKSVKFDGDLQPFYFPTFEQQKSAENYTDFFETSGFPVNSVDRWSTGNTCYSTGWTLGNLVFIEANKIDGAYSDGTLKPADILLTDGIPAEVPFVAGLVSMAPSTANSHVAILAKTFNIPFVYLSKESDREHARTLIGKEVALRAVNDYERCTVRHEEIIGLEKKERSELLALKKTSTLNFPQKEKAGKYFSSADILTPSETKFYGGKSSNFGILRTSIPDNSPTPAIAFSFDLFDDFMTLKISSRKTVRQEIDALLNSYSYPPDVASLYSNLSKIRDMIENDVEFSSEMKEKVKTALASFDQNKKIRFRSSTNVEDTTTFSGAGLYDSYSGCLADDKDSDDKGPSKCDSSKSNERGVFRAIKKVFASFYNNNAFFERLRHNVDENKVGMALLVYHSFSSDVEIANGVITYQNKGRGTADIVSQPGEASVTNPDSDAQPEIVVVTEYNSGPSTRIKQYSDLLPMGDSVLNTPDDYKTLFRLVEKAAEKFESFNQGKENYILDLEYKKLKDGTLIIKQIRKIPNATTAEAVTPFILNIPSKLCVFQGEDSNRNVFANHRLKTIWNMNIKNKWLSKENISSTIFTSFDYEYIDSENTLSNFSNDIASLDGYAYSYSRNDSQLKFVDSWETGSGENLKKYSIISIVTRDTFDTKNGPFVFPDANSANRQDSWDDMIFIITADFSTPKIIKRAYEDWATTTTDEITLGMCNNDYRMDWFKSKTINAIAGKITLDTTFYYPPGPTGASSGYTAPNVKWEKTEIIGLTTEPIVLKGYYSQSFMPEHHNFDEHFLFEPLLEDGISETTINELKEKKVRYIYMKAGYDAQEVFLINFDGKTMKVE